MLFKRKADRVADLSDEDLVLALQRHMDADHFGILYDRYSARVFQKCIGMTRDRDMAKDLTHDIFLKVFVNLVKFDNRSKFGTWLYSITYNYCLDHLRKEQRVRKEDIDERIGADPTDEHAGEAQLLGLRAERLDKVIGQLDPADRALLLMKYEDDLSVKEMQEAMSISESAVKMRLLRARDKALAKYHELYPEEP